MAISMDIMLAHLLIKTEYTYALYFYFFPCPSFLLFIFSSIYVTESNE